MDDTIVNLDDYRTDWMSILDINGNCHVIPCSLFEDFIAGKITWDIIDKDNVLLPVIIKYFLNKQREEK